MLVSCVGSPSVTRITNVLQQGTTVDVVAHAGVWLLPKKKGSLPQALLTYPGGQTSAPVKAEISDPPIEPVPVAWKATPLDTPPEKEMGYT
jgi:hypothetical protein